MKSSILSELERDAERFDEVQQEILQEILHKNCKTEYGTEHGFGNIKSVQEYQSNVPITEYEDYREYIDRMLRKTEKNLITAYPIRYYMVSSGTTGAGKEIPMTEEGIDAYAHYSYDCAEELADRYYSRSGDVKAADKHKVFLLNEIRKKKLTENEDSLLVSSAVFERAREQGALDYDKYTSPEEVLFPSCHMDMNYLKLRFALACGEVTSIQGVYIHQILNIMSYLEQNWEPLVNDIEKGTIRDGITLPEDIRAKLERRIAPMPERAAQLRREFEAGFDKPIAPRIWKTLCFVMAISGSVFEPYMKKLRRYIGDTPYHYFIYAASEGFFGTAYEINSDTYILAPRAGFYEFLPLDGEEETAGIIKAVDASQVKQGEKYELVYTGFSGLYRYRMGDVLEVIGFHKKAPLVKFRYRRKQCVNVAGEKMDIQSIVQAVEIFAEQCHIHVQEFSVYQDMDCMPGRYVFFIETPSKVEAGDYDKASEMLDRLLCRQSMDYEDCRDLGEIGAAQIYFLKEGAFEAYKEYLQENGVETGQYKPIRLLDTQARYSFFMERAKHFQEELEH